MNTFGKDGVLHATTPLRLPNYAFMIVSNDPEYGTQWKFNQLSNLRFSLLNRNICITGPAIPWLLGSLSGVTGTVTDSRVHGWICVLVILFSSALFFLACHGRKKPLSQAYLCVLWHWINIDFIHLLLWRFFALCQRPWSRLKYVMLQLWRAQTKRRVPGTGWWVSS